MGRDLEFSNSGALQFIIRRIQKKSLGSAVSVSRYLFAWYPKTG
jgi:hypothetical protein